MNLSAYATHRGVNVSTYLKEMLEHPCVRTAGIIPDDTAAADYAKDKERNIDTFLALSLHIVNFLLDGIMEKKMPEGADTYMQICWHATGIVRAVVTHQLMQDRAQWIYSVKVADMYQETEQKYPKVVLAIKGNCDT